MIGRSLVCRNRRYPEERSIFVCHSSLVSFRFGLSRTHLARYPLSISPTNQPTIQTYLPIYVSTYLPALSVCLLAHLPTYLPTWLPTCFPGCSFSCLPACLPACLLLLLLEKVTCCAPYLFFLLFRSSYLLHRHPSLFIFFVSVDVIGLLERYFNFNRWRAFVTIIVRIEFTQELSHVSFFRSIHRRSCSERTKACHCRFLSRICLEFSFGNIR